MIGTRHILMTVFPNLGGLHEDTLFTVYRSYDPEVDKVRLVVHYKEPSGYPMIIEARAEVHDPEYVLGPEDVNIISWRKSD